MGTGTGESARWGVLATPGRFVTGHLVAAPPAPVTPGFGRLSRGERTLVSLLGEALFPLVLISRRARRVLPPLLLSMQLGIALFLGIHFWAFLPAYAFFVPWDRLQRGHQSKATRAAPPSGPRERRSPSRSPASA